jgi:hypothetical protein
MVFQRALLLWNSIQIYTEDIRNVFNCHNVAKHCKFDARNSVRPLLLHGDYHYRYRVSGHVPTQRWPRKRILFQQDGAVPHYLEEVREYLKTQFPGRWIGRAMPIAWPLRSPDLTPLDFFSWGFIKDRLFVPTLPANVAELRTRITAAVAEVTPEMLRSVWQGINYRWDICRITNGSHIEP